MQREDLLHNLSRSPKGAQVTVLIEDRAVKITGLEYIEGQILLTTTKLKAPDRKAAIQLAKNDKQATEDPEAELPERMTDEEFTRQREAQGQPLTPEQLDEDRRNRPLGHADVMNQVLTDRNIADDVADQQKEEREGKGAEDWRLGHGQAYNADPAQPRSPDQIEARDKENQRKTKGAEKQEAEADLIKAKTQDNPNPKA